MDNLKSPYATKIVLAPRIINPKGKKRKKMIRFKLERVIN
jgi:hypothetical protein